MGVDALEGDPRGVEAREGGDLLRQGAGDPGSSSAGGMIGFLRVRYALSVCSGLEPGRNHWFMSSVGAAASPMPHHTVSQKFKLAIATTPRNVHVHQLAEGGCVEVAV